MAETRLTGWRSALDAFATLAIVAACATVIFNRNGSDAVAARAPKELAVPTQPVSIKDAALKGTATALPVMIEFSDFECPFCSRAALDILPQIDKEFVAPGLLRVAFKHVPLPIHSNAVRAAESAECAGQQGRFWAMHDVLFRDPKRLGPNDLSLHAKAAGLDEAVFELCMQKGLADRVRRDSDEASRLGIRGTPTFMFGVANRDGDVAIRSTLVGMAPVAQFRQKIQDIVENAGTR